METKEELFNQFQMLGKKYQRLGIIVQNEGQVVTHQELDEFEAELESLLAQMRKMSQFVVAHYQREDGIVG